MTDVWSDEAMAGLDTIVRWATWPITKDGNHLLGHPVTAPCEKRRRHDVAVEHKTTRSALLGTRIISYNINCRGVLRRGPATSQTRFVFELGSGLHHAPPPPGTSGEAPEAQMWSNIAGLRSIYGEE